AALLALLMLARPDRDIVKKVRNNLEAQSLIGLRFYNRDLTDVLFRNSDLSSVTFQSCDMSRARFEGAFLKRTRFEGVNNLTGAHLVIWGARSRSLLDDRSSMTLKR